MYNNRNLYILYTSYTYLDKMKNKSKNSKGGDFISQFFIEITIQIPDGEKISKETSIKGTKKGIVERCKELFKNSDNIVNISIERNQEPTNTPIVSIDKRFYADYEKDVYNPR